MRTRHFIPQTILIIIILSFTVYAAGFEQVGKVTITTSSKDAYEYFKKGRDLQERLQGQESIQYFEKALTQDPNFAMAYLYLSFVTPSNKGFFENLENAKQNLDKVSEGEKLWITGFDAGVNGFAMKQREFYKKLASQFPQDERVQNLLAAHYFGQQDYQKAIEYYTRAIEINPSFSTPYNQLGYAQRFLTNYKEAEKAFKKYIELIPDDPNPYDSYAELLMKMGKFDQSIDTYKKALAFNPNFVASYIGIATNLNLQGKHQQAREQLKKLYEIARNDGERRAVHFAIAVSYVDEGKMNEAIKELEKQYVLAQKINDAGAMAGDFVVMGNIYLEMENFEQASKNFEKALNVAKNSNLSKEVKDNFHRGYLYNITRTAVKKNDLASAKKTAEEYRILVEKIQNPFQIRLSHETWAMIALAEKQYDKALEGFQKSNLQNPYNLYRIALAHQGKGDQVRAKTYFERAKKFNGLNNLNYAFVRNLL